MSENCKKEVKSRVKKAVLLLKKNQKLSGEFSTYVSPRANMTPSKYFLSPFTSTFVLHSLKYISNFREVKIIARKVIRFLLSQMESPGIWRFYGRGSSIFADLDDTCCALAALFEHNVHKINYGYLIYYLQRFRAGNNLFYTWMKSPLEEKNDIDVIVNANTLYFFSLQNKTPPEVARYLNAVATNNCLKLGFYCPSRYTFAYALTRAYADGQARYLRVSIPSVRRVLLKNQKTDGCWGDELDTAFAAVALLNTGYGGNEISQAVRFLLNTQLENGSWPSISFSLGPSVYNPRAYYGSEEFTTAVCLEALGKFTGITATSNGSDS